MRTTFCLIAAAFLFAAISCQSKTEEKALEFNLGKGKSYEYEIVTDVDQETKEGKTKLGMIAVFMITVMDDNGAFTLDIAYKDFKLNMNLRGQEVNIDAAVRPSSLQTLTDVFSEIIGKKFTMKVNRDGHIDEITGFEEIIKSILEKITVDPDMKAAMAASLTDQLNISKTKEIFAPIFSVYPGKDIKVGDKWKNSYDIPSQGTQYNSEYTAKSFEGDKIVVDVKSIIDTQRELENSALSDLKTTGTETGLLTLEAKSGLVVDGQLIQNFQTSGALEMKVVGTSKIRGRRKT